VRHKPLSTVGRRGIDGSSAGAEPHCSLMRTLRIPSHELSKQLSASPQVSQSRPCAWVSPRSTRRFVGGTPRATGTRGDLGGFRAQAKKRITGLRHGCASRGLVSIARERRTALAASRDSPYPTGYSRAHRARLPLASSRREWEKKRTGDSDGFRTSEQKWHPAYSR